MPNIKKPPDRPEEITLRFYQGNALDMILFETSAIKAIRHLSQPLAIVRTHNALRSFSLLKGDHHGTVSRDLIETTYSAYGYCTDSQHSMIAFKGEHPENIDGRYFLGNGYRSYSPRLGRFESSDVESPFGIGGLNSYMFAVGDPVNRTDPSGRGSGVPISPPLVFKGRIQLIKGLRVYKVDSDKVPTGSIITVVAHGNGAGKLGKKYGPYYSAEKLYRELKRSNVPINTHPTHLLSCRGANTSILNKIPAAQEWANLTGQPAISYRGEVVAARTKIPRSAKESFEGFINVFTHENFKPVTFYPDGVSMTETRNAIRNS